MKKEERDNFLVVSLFFGSLKRLEIDFSSSSVSNVLVDDFYNAAGQKVQKKVTSGTEIIRTDYLDGFQYVQDTLRFFPTAEGYVKNTPLNGLNTYDYVYNYTDPDVADLQSVTFHNEQYCDQKILSFIKIKNVHKV